MNTILTAFENCIRESFTNQYKKYSKTTEFKLDVSKCYAPLLMSVNGNDKNELRTAMFNISKKVIEVNNKGYNVSVSGNAFDYSNHLLTIKPPVMTQKSEILDFDIPSYDELRSIYEKQCQGSLVEFKKDISDVIKYGFDDLKKDGIDKTEFQIYHIKCDNHMKLSLQLRKDAVNTLSNNKWDFDFNCFHKKGGYHCYIQVKAKI
jgi:hypothetical protein